MSKDFLGFFSKAANTKPFLKMALEGFAGTGKTHTAADIAMGLHARIKSTKAVVFFDTERSSKFLANRFKEAGIELLVKDSKSLADLVQTLEMSEKEGIADIVIIDSISHVWENVLEEYKAKTRRNRIEFQDWGILKPTWKREFSDRLVNSPLHIIFTGRAGFEYENEKNEETGKREIYKSGIKMKVEGETAYEPDILVLMERFEELLTDKKDVWRQATVIKDRSTLIDGKVFKNPTYNDFSPAIEELLAEPAKMSEVPTGDDRTLFRTEEDRRDWVRSREIVLEQIENLVTMVVPGSSAVDKRYKSSVIYASFPQAGGSWEGIKQLRPEDLREGMQRIQERFVADGIIAVDGENGIAFTGKAVPDLAAAPAVPASPAPVKEEKAPKHAKKI